MIELSGLRSLSVRLFLMRNGRRVATNFFAAKNV